MHNNILQLIVSVIKINFTKVEEGVKVFKQKALLHDITLSAAS